MLYIKYLVESYQSKAFSQNKNLFFFGTPSFLAMDYDPAILQRIVHNLISNALKVTDSFGRIEVFASAQSKELILDVIDDGIGIEADKIPHIFDLFYQADDSSTRKLEGMGIGLNIVDQMVKGLGGEIKVVSEPGKGSHFSVRLPIHKNAENQIAIQNEILQAKINQLEIDPSKSIEHITTDNELPIVLIVEDSIDVINYLKIFLSPHYQCLEAHNGKEGLVLAQEYIPDIIISDVMMPEMDGFEFCEKVKSDFRTSHIPIIMLTALSDFSNRLKGLSLGADAYIAKPFEQKELLIRLERLITLRKNLQFHYSQKEYNNNVSESLPEGQFVQQLHQVILAHLDDEDFTVVSLAKEMQLSRAQLYRKVKALTGQNVSHIIRTIRLKEARQLLQSTSLNISEIAYKVGFKYPNHFSRAFKEYFGIPPIEIRK